MVSVTCCCSASTRRRSTASLSTSSMSTTSGSASGLSACSRDSSMIWPTRSVSRADSMPIRLANLRTAVGVVGRVLDRLGEQRDRADRGLQLVADVGDEVAPGLLDPARRRSGRRPAPPSGRPPAARPERRSVRTSARSPGRSGGRRYAELRSRRTLADQLQELGDGDPAAADQAEGPGGAGRLAAPRRAARPRRRRSSSIGQHLRDSGRHDRIGALEGRRRLRAGGRRWPIHTTSTPRPRPTTSADERRPPIGFTR